MKNNSSLCWADVNREAPAWFRDAKFGLFFHLGPYSVPAYENEWYSRNMYAKVHHKTCTTLRPWTLDKFGYKDFYSMFRCEKFDPDEWAERLSVRVRSMPGL